MQLTVLNSNIKLKYNKYDKNSLSVFDYLQDNKDEILKLVELDLDEYKITYSKNKSGPTLPIVPWYSFRKRDKSKLDIFSPTILFDMSSKRIYISVQFWTDYKNAESKNNLLSAARGALENKVFKKYPVIDEYIFGKESTRPINYAKYSVVTKEITMMSERSLLGIIKEFIDISKVLNSDYPVARSDGELANMDAAIKAGESFAVIKTRIGQAPWKRQLIKKYGGICALCNIDHKNLLVASHIKPWSKSVGDERTSVFNGIILCNNHDSLFDKGFITFLDNGKIKISNDIANFKKELNVSSETTLRDKYTINGTIKNINKYMEYHRDKKFK